MDFIKFLSGQVLLSSVYLWKQKAELLITLNGKKVPGPQCLQGPMEKNKGQGREKAASSHPWAQKVPQEVDPTGKEVL